MAVIDICTYNGEKDIWDIHYHVLKDYVDEFIVVEFDTTFSGKKKQQSFFEIFKNYKNVVYELIPESMYRTYYPLAKESKYTQGADHWKREFAQKESIKDVLKHCNDDDVVFIGDVDEIWDPEYCMPHTIGMPIKLKLDVYTYYLNLHSNEQFWGTLATQYAFIKDGVLNHIRAESPKTRENEGWHFTSMGGYEMLKKKLEDSYTHESYANTWVMHNLHENIQKQKDFLGREFQYTKDETKWPTYLKEHRNKYKHLCH